jgi:hypothetical protein
MLVAIRGAGTNIRDERSGEVLGTIPRGGLVASWIRDDPEWSVYQSPSALIKLHRGWHQRVTIPSYQIPIKFVSQLGVGADRFTGDCGAAGLDMILGDVSPNVDAIAAAMGLGQTYEDRETGEKKVKKIGWIADIIRASFSLGIRVNHSSALDCYEAVLQISRERPFIQLVDYEELPVRRDQRYRGGHFIVVCGVSPEGVTYVDPYQTSLQRVVVPWAQWSEIIGRSRYNNTTQGVVLA